MYMYSVCHISVRWSEPFLLTHSDHSGGFTQPLYVNFAPFIAYICLPLQILELEGHPFYVAVQYHPEYLSRPMRPSAPYLGLILAATGKLRPFLAKG